MKFLRRVFNIFFGGTPSNEGSPRVSYKYPIEAASSESPQVKIQGYCSVIDGDSLIIKGTNIRLAGIDAPELDHPFGKNAKWALIKLCKGQVVTAELAGAVSYNRAVATCFLPDGRDLSAEMVKLGLAVDWPKFSSGKYREFEQPGVRRKLWRCDARQRGRMPSTNSAPPLASESTL